MSDRKATQFPSLPDPGPNQSFFDAVKEAIESMVGFRRGVLGLARVIYSSEEPLHGVGGVTLRAGDLWVDRTANNKLRVWSGSVWEETT